MATVYKCDRCGKIMPKLEADCTLRFCVESFSDLAYEQSFVHLNFDLCEQCCTTIKEVLEDGEIK